MPEFINFINSNISKDALFEYINKKRDPDPQIQLTVSNVISDVKEKGDKALAEYSLKFDSYELSTNQIKVNSEEIHFSNKEVPEKQKQSINRAYKRIYDYHSKQVLPEKTWEDGLGVQLGWFWNPIEKCALYVPGGTAPLFSSVLMMGVPAKVANVPFLAMVVPPNQALNPLIIYAASLVGVDEIYRIGGCQAIAALAYGTETVSAVDKIFGPGNAFVSEAKRQVFGTVGIDMIAGPSEVVIICDDSVRINWVAADLIAQAEHDYLAKPIVIVPNEKIGKQVNEEVLRQTEDLPRKEIIQHSWKKNGLVITVESHHQALEIANLIGPEHLQLAVENTEKYLGLVHNAGSVFLGESSPEAIGDYLAGPNHVLPTNGAARFTSGLSVIDFCKRTSVIHTPLTAIQSLGPDAIRIAQSEDLHGHANSIQFRMSAQNTRTK